MKKQTGRNFVYRAAARMLLFTGSPASPAEAGGLLYFGIFVLITGLVSIIYPYFFLECRSWPKGQNPAANSLLDHAANRRSSGLCGCGSNAVESVPAITPLDLLHTLDR